MRILVALDKIGDVINLFPLLQAEPDTRLMVLKEHAPLFHGISYSEPIVFDGEFHELNRAVKEAQAITPDVRSVTFTGEPETIKALTFKPAGATHAISSSFAKEVWRIACRIDLWNEQPKLVFDKRDAEREAALLESVCPVKRGRKRKLMLVSAGGTSSPFQYRELLLTLLTLKFEPKYQIVDLSTIKAERFYDLLALYERADVLVTTDSAPLHLAQACPDLPVVAFVNDKPTLWFGSPWRANHVFHCRYSGFPNRAMEMLSRMWRPVTYGDVHIWNGYSPIQPPNGAPLHIAPCPAELKVFGRDSHTGKITNNSLPRSPFLKDMLRMASWRCGSENDTITIARPETRWVECPTVSEPPCWAHRSTKEESGNLTYHPQPDLFAFTKMFYVEHRKELPDLLCDDGPWWGRVMREWLRKHGGKEIPFAIYKDNYGTKPQYGNYNEKLAREWFAKHNIDLTTPKVSEQLPSTRIHGLSPFGYNGSIIEHGGRTFLAYRWHPHGDAKTILMIAELDSQLDTIANREVKLQGAHSFEDPRLFVHRGELWMSWVASEWPKHTNAVVRHGRLIETQFEWRMDVAPIVEYGKNDFSACEKNWVPFTLRDELFFIYGNMPNQNVLTSENGSYVTAFPHWKWGTVKGGCIAPSLYRGKMLRFFHSRLDNEPRPYGHRYYVGCALMNPEPPFETVALSSEPILKASEHDDLPLDKRQSCQHHKQRVVFPAGVIERNGKWLLSVGINDSAVSVVTIKPEDLKL